MSVCGHTCRHVLHRASWRLDSVWISDELLSSTFKRFVKNQRRYGSRVPGPLEASKRLAKRRNTALAVGGSSSSFDPAANVANLFGANGTGHVRQWDDSAWSSRWPEPLELFSYSDQPPPPPLPSFLAQAANPAEHLSDIGGNLPYEHDNFTSLLAECRSVEAVNDALEWFRVDVREDPEYSRIIFRHLFDLTTRENNTRAVHELLIFLDDASLNIYGVGNHSELIGRLSSSGLAMSHKAKLVKNVTKAMSLGLVPVGEINRILQLLPSIIGHGQSLDTVLEDVWDALQSCSLFKLHEIGQDVLEPWIDQLLAMNQRSSLRLAKEVMFTYKESLKVLADSYALRALEVLSSRMPLSVTSHDIFTTFLRQLLARSDSSSLKIAKDIILTYHRHESRSPQPIAEILCHHLFTQASHDSSKDISHFMVDLLGQLSPDVATRYIILITEGITFVDRGDEFRSHRLKIWRNCLLQLERRAILSSREWYEPKMEGCANASKGLKIALRIWGWMALNTTPHRKLKRPHPGHSDEKSLNAVGISLLKIFDDVTTSIMWRFHGNRTEILPKLVAGLQQLDVPCSQVLSKAYTLMSHRHIKNQSTLQAFQKLEEGRLTLAQAALQRHVFNSTKRYLLSSHLRFIQEIDVTSPEFIANMVESIEKDNGRIRDMIFIISLHTPLKIALAMASTRNAGHVANTKRVKATLRLERKGKQLYLEPHACVSFVHLLASSIALSEQVSPRAAFNLLTYLYRYLISHNAPVKPGFARALYHCGITRFSRSGLRVSAAQEDHVMEIVRRHEEPEAAQALMSGSYIEYN